MSYPCIYNEEGKCKLNSTVYEHSWCVEGPCDSQTLSNGDRIRAMSDEELAWELMQFRFDAYGKAEGDESVLPDSQKKIENWLKQPAEVDNDTD